MKTSWAELGHTRNLLFPLGRGNREKISLHIFRFLGCFEIFNSLNFLKIFCNLLIFEIFWIFKILGILGILGIFKIF